MAYTNYQVAGPTTPFAPSSSLYLNAPILGSFTSGPPPFPQDCFLFTPQPVSHSDYRLPQGKGRRPSLVSQPYSIAQSPTRNRLHYESDTNAAGLFEPFDANQGYYAPLQESPRHRARPHKVSGAPEQKSRGDRRPSLSKNLFPNHEPAQTESRAPATVDTPCLLPGVDGPMNHLRVPQPQHESRGAPHDPRSLCPPIKFYMQGMAEPGVRLADYSPSLQGADDIILQKLVETKINVVVQWPGYRSCSARVPTHKGNLTRLGLWVHISQSIRRYLEHAKKELQCVKGHNTWALGMAFQVDNVFLTEVVHRGGADWQVELWCTGEQLY